MTINFSVNDVVNVNTTYVNSTLKNAANIKTSTITLLGYLSDNTSIIVEIGIFNTEPFIRVVPTDPVDPTYHSGDGAVLYFNNDGQLNNSFTLVSSSSSPASDAKVDTVQTATGEALLTAPAVVGSTQTTSTFVIFDTLGAHLGGITIETDGASRVELWCGLHVDNDMGDAEISWRFGGTVSLPEPGTHLLSPSLIFKLSQCRYLKFERICGADITVSVYGAFRQLA